jgi:hypothetical protein
LTWSIAEKYIGHFFCTGTQCSGTFFQQKNTLNPSKSKLWVTKFRPLCTSICRIFYTVPIANFLAILGICTKCVLLQAKIEFLGKTVFLELMVVLQQKQGNSLKGRLQIIT